MSTKGRLAAASLVLTCALYVVTGASFAQTDFRAFGVSRPEVKYLDAASSPVPRRLRRVAVEVCFDLVPTKMRFSMPCYPCLVTENGIHFSNGWTETYDPKASSSCEVLWDHAARYSRMWIASQNQARIVVRWRAALVDPDGYVAHSDIPSGSPYGRGDWTDEWYYIYPDGTHTRYVRIYTGLAAQSLTVTDQTFDDVEPIREIPPNVVHEFQEDFVFGMSGRLPEDDIELAPLTLIKMDGRSKTIAYRPYPKDFGEFADANIKVVNTKSEYRPYTIFVPYGLENEPYPPEGELRHIFQTWPREPTRGYSASLGHSLNWWHYRRTKNLLEQVYLSGMTRAGDPAKELIARAKSWLQPPQLQMPGLEPEYKTRVHDPAQNAYTLSCGPEGAKKFRFTLATASGERQGECSIVDPAFVLRSWGGQDAAVSFNGEVLERGVDYRTGHEVSGGQTDLVVWVNRRANRPAEIEITPVAD